MLKVLEYAEIMQLDFSLVESRWVWGAYYEMIVRYQLTISYWRWLDEQETYYYYYYYYYGSSSRELVVDQKVEMMVVVMVLTSL
jgi:hypothetical protein